MNKTPPYWRTLGLTYLSVQVAGILLGNVYIMLREDSIVIPVVLWFSVIIGIPVTAIPTILFSVVITHLACRVMLHRPSIQLHALGASVAVVIFWASLFVLREGPCSVADFLALAPFMLASVGAALVGTVVARASLKRYTGELHNNRQNPISGRRIRLPEKD